MNNPDNVMVVWTFEGINNDDVRTKLEELNIQVTDVEMTDTGWEDVTFVGTEENLRKFFAHFWDMNVDSEEVNEIFEYYL